MILWALVLLAAVLASEVLLHLPLLAEIRKVTTTARKSMRILASKRISDHWKERILPSYSWQIGRGSAVFFVMLCVVLLPVALLGFVYPGGIAAWGAVLMRPLVMLVLCLASIGYIWLRVKVRRG